jgi:hypothetical protein
MMGVVLLLCGTECPKTSIPILEEVSGKLSKVPEIIISFEETEI